MYHITIKSNNAKTGPIPVSTSSAETCPASCPLKRSGCYARSGPLALRWKAVTSGKRGTSIDGFCDTITQLPDGQLWRHNQAGDLPGQGDAIDVESLDKIVQANSGKRGFTYTHKPMNDNTNLNAVKRANANGFTVNLSANNLIEADTLADLRVGPVVVLLPKNAPKKTTTPNGRKVITCPAQYSDKLSCAKCGLCQLADRDYVIGFRAHGAGSKSADAIASR